MTTISQLQVSVDSWLVRNDVAVTGSDFNQILLIAESSIARNYRFLVQEVTTTLTFTGRSEDLPADFLEVRNPFIDDNIRKFEYQTPQAIRENSAWANGRAGAFYTLEGSEDTVNNPAVDDRVKMTIAGPASASSPLSVDVNYYRRFPALDTGTPTDSNWLLTQHYDVYLYETLHAAAVYLQERELAADYLGLCQGLRNEFKLQENRKRFAAVPKQAYANPRGVV
jgi:hypothetical protein